MAAGKYINRVGDEVLIPSVGVSTDVIAPDRFLAAKAGTPGAGRIELTHETTLGCGARLSAAGFRSIALNFADPFIPGGRYLDGGLSQEEGCCRQSTLWSRLVEPEARQYYEANEKLGGAKFTNWAIVSRNVAVFRDDVCGFLERPFMIDFLTIPAPIADATLWSDGIVMRSRIERLLEIACWSGARALILGAFGCGAFCNDPLVTAQIFKESLAKGDIRKRFDLIVFAIFDAEGHCWNGFESWFASEV